MCASRDEKVPWAPEELLPKLGLEDQQDPVGKRCEAQCELNSTYRGLEECGKGKYSCKSGTGNSTGGWKTWFQVQLIAHQLLQSWNLENVEGEGRPCWLQKTSVERIVATYIGKGTVTSGIALNPQAKDSLTHLTHCQGLAGVGYFLAFSFPFSSLPPSHFFAHLLCPCSQAGSEASA